MPTSLCGRKSGYREKCSLLISRTGASNSQEHQRRSTCRQIARDPLCHKNDLAQIIGIKTYLDGGMLTGSAYMREPWGKSDIYAITDPTYRGLLFIPRERLLPIVRTAVE